MILRDIRYALHTLRRSPGYTLLCMGVLALGIGANAAIFSVLDSVIFQALPYPDPGRLVFVWERFPNMPPPIGPRMRVAYKNFVEWQRQSAVFSGLAAFREIDIEEAGADSTRHVSTGFASAELFHLLGTHPPLGRLFTSAEERDGAGRVAVLSDAYFDRRFRRDPSALGKTITVGDTAYTVIGVLPPKFHLPSTGEGFDQVKADVWVPFSRTINRETPATDRQFYAIARLKPGVSLDRARAEMAGIAGRLAKTDPKLNEGMSTSVFPFAVEETDPVLHRALYVLMAAVGFLLLIACANLANLTLARAALRSREIAVRLALGATRARIVSQLVTESLLVSLAGAGVGLLLAHWSLRLMLSLHPDSIQRPELISIDLRVFAFATLASILTTVVFGLAPSIAASRTDLNTALKSGGAWGATAARLRSRQVLITVEVALALVLVVGAGLMIRSFRELLAVGIGFDTTRITYADIDLPAQRYPGGDAQVQFFRTLLDRVQAMPGVAATAVVDNAPLHRVSMANFSIVGRPEPPLSALPMADVAQSSPGYLRAVGLRLEAGRWFTDADLPLSGNRQNGVVIVDRAFARQFFPGEDPLAHRLAQDKQSFEIVGVVSGYRSMGVENGTRPTVFWPALALGHATLVVRSALPPRALATAVRNAIRSVDRLLPAPEVKSMQYWVDVWLSQRTFNTLLPGIFASLALLLGMLGIYGVLANLVASHIREIGIRLAIGATPAEIGGLVLRQGMLPVLIGLAIGLAASLALSRFLEALLFQVQPRDPVTLAAAAFAILVFSPLAIAIPLLRATRVDCTVALREE
ncbi:MAG: ABC transporter permease [Bryobacteraceae bacterium]|jgi:predicted permease